MKIQDYTELTKKQRLYVMNYNSKNPPHQIINNKIKFILNNKNYVH